MNKSATSVVGVSFHTFRAWRSFISIVTSPGGYSLAKNSPYAYAYKEVSPRGYKYVRIVQNQESYHIITFC